LFANALVGSLIAALLPLRVESGVGDQLIGRVEASDVSDFAVEDRCSSLSDVANALQKVGNLPIFYPVPTV
jgi:hypothetical protein